MVLTADKEELLKILNDDGSFAGYYEKRSISHKNGLYHQEVGFIPINKKGEILIQKRSKDKKSYAGCWALCAGHVVGDESIKEAAVKEANEELGLNLTENDLLLLVDTTKNDRDDNRCFATCFYKCIDKPLSYFKKQDEEVDELAWVTINEFEEMVKAEKNCIFKNNKYYQNIIASLKEKV